MNLSEYAKYRNISTEAVRLAIKDGRLKRSVRDVTPPGAKKKKIEIDPMLADSEWEANTDASRRFNVRKVPAAVPEGAKPLRHWHDEIAAPDSAQAEEIMPGIPFKEAQRLETEFSARLKRLKYEQEIGRLADVEQIEAAWVKIVTEAKTKLLAIPSKAKANLPHLMSTAVGISPDRGVQNSPLCGW